MAPEEGDEMAPAAASPDSASVDVAASAQAEPENVFSTPDETTDVILEVEGRELHASRAVLAHYSPVFRKMFYSDFKEKSSEKVPLPGKQYSTMVTFCNVLYPRSASAKCLINDSNLMDMLTLADEYQTDKIMTACQRYIGDQLFSCFHDFYQHSVSQAQRQQRATQSSVSTSGGGFFGSQKVQAAPAYNFGQSASTFSYGIPAASPFPQKLQPPGTLPDTRGQKLTKEMMIQKLVLYMWACDAHQLPAHREMVKSLLVDVSVRLKDVAQSQHYPSLPDTAKAELLEELCRKFDGSREF